VQHDGENPPSKTTQDEYGKGRHEEEEVFVVATSNAVVNPRTMVVELLRESINNIMTLAQMFQFQNLAGTEYIKWVK